MIAEKMMGLKKKVLFIINPISGGKNKKGVPALIEKYLDSDKFEYRIDISTGVLHAQQLAQKNVKQYDIIVAVGGDGTINEVASVIAGTDTALGIIPYGSGNGLSRFLGIPMDPEGAIKTLSRGIVHKIDAAKLNGEWFFNLAGVGFDAHIAEIFSRGKTRGFITYLKESIKEYSNYKSQKYLLTIDGRKLEAEAFMLNFANSSQFGNNVHIAPHASVQDGLLDVCIVKQAPFYRFLDIGFRLFNKTIDKSDYIDVIQGKHITVKREAPGAIHLDGEPQMAGLDFEIKIVPAALNIVTGSTFQS